MKTENINLKLLIKDLCTVSNKIPDDELKKELDNIIKELKLMKGSKS